MSADSGATTMHIGELAERTSLSLRTIRHYDEIGLLTPSGRTDGGFRLYTHDDFQRLMLIRRMKPLGYSLDEMAALLAVIDGASVEGSALDGASVDLGSFIAEAEERRAALALKVEMADEFVALLRGRAR